MSEDKKKEPTACEPTQEEVTPLPTDETAGGEGDHHHHHHHDHSHSHHGHGHSHHRHHRHKHRKSHGKRRSSSQKTKRRIRAFIKKNKHTLVNVVACLVSVSLLISFAIVVDRPGQDDNNAQTLTQSSVIIESTLFTGEVALVDQAIVEYFSETNDKTAHDVYGLHKGYDRTINVATPLQYSYKVTGLPVNVMVVEGIFEVSQQENYADSQQYKVDLANPVVEVYHLMVNTTYYYRLQLTLSNDSKVGAVGQFTTAKTPRVITVEGAANVRDIGGWQTADGKIVGQGLLYRGTEIDGGVEAQYKITQKGIDTLVNTLGIRFDMDLRAAGTGSATSPLGAGVTHQYYNVPYYESFFNSTNNQAIRNVFVDLSNEHNYPIYLHCTHGRDRTGMICYLLETFLGVSEKQAYQDYEMSAFTNSYISEADFALFKNQLLTFTGATIQEKAETYLISIGVTPAQLQAIREIFLG